MKLLMTKKNIISFMFLLSACLFFLNSLKENHIAMNGEYHASIYIINKKNTSELRVSAHIEKDDFVTTTYVSSPALKGIAKFISKGTFMEHDGNGNYIYRYELTQVGNVDVIDTHNAEVYLGMVGRSGLPKEEKIKMLYHSNTIDIFDTMRGGNIVMYVKK